MNLIENKTKFKHMVCLPGVEFTASLRVITFIEFETPVLKV